MLLEDDFGLEFELVNVGSEADKGEYRCTRCHFVLEVGKVIPHLPPCPRCGSNNEYEIVTLFLNGLEGP